MKFYSSEEYARFMGPDCKYFMTTLISVYVGEKNLVFRKAMEASGDAGKDGIMR